MNRRPGVLLVTLCAGFVPAGGLRLEVVLPREWSAGIQEWKVR
jgi:hypothetical protein